MTIKEALNHGAKRLQNQKEARILLAHHLGCDALSLILKEAESVEDVDAYFALIERAKNSEPLEYITQEVSFYGENFFIKKGALIPRPETEILIDKVLEVAKNIKNPKIAEIGVGSGIISIMIAKLRKDATITATDISKEAIEIAKTNASRFGVAKQIRFIHTPYLIDIQQKFDIIISNPPYIAEDAPLERNLAYEPDIALFGGKKGDEILKNIIDIAAYHDNCVLCCEMGYDQKEPLQRYMADKNLAQARFYKDLAGFDRGFILKIGEKHQK